MHPILKVQTVKNSWIAVQDILLVTSTLTASTGWVIMSANVMMATKEIQTIPIFVKVYICVSFQMRMTPNGT